MLKKDITFENIDGEEVTETFYFNLNKAEMAEMELRFGEKGLEEHFKNAVATKDRGTILDLYKYILTSTIGRREGNLFVKNEKITSEFLHSGAYSQMFVDLFNDPAQIIEFFRGVLPNSMKDKYDKVIADQMDVETPQSEKGRSVPASDGTPMHLPPGGDGEPVPWTDAERNFALTTEAERRLAEEIFRPEKPSEFAKKLEEYTKPELMAMSQEDFDRLVGTNPQMMPRAVLNIAFERRMKGPDK